MKHLPSGVDLIKALSDGSLRKTPTKYVEETRTAVKDALEELIEVGARIRPLIVNKTQIGWVRGIPPRERRMLGNWVSDQAELIEQVFKLCTTLSLQEIQDLSLSEMRYLARLIRQMTDSDLLLYPYISAFVTTSVSESLWYADGGHADFKNRIVQMPDGREVKLLCASDHARLWAHLCVNREESKRRVEDATNAVLIVRAWVGKGADPLANDLKNAAQMLRTDVLEPWSESITLKERKESYEDGWAHSEDESVEGIQRELQGMLTNDRHERLMAEFHKQQAEREAKQQADIRAALAKRDLVKFEAGTRPMSKAEFKQREESIQAKKPKLGPSVLEDESEKAQQTAVERLTKYK
jgi:hypothetical protein